MNIRVFNVCLLLGWILVLVGGIVIHPGWGLAIAGALLIALTLAAAYIAGWEPSKPPAADNKGETA